ncbi:MAG TPA: endolytic transglycosylase MltG [Nitrospiraceae bacterium]|nr:endolytic transglycosylase MltG [Nitrospiraceae bacterium]
MNRTWRFKEIIAIIVSLIFFVTVYIVIYLIMPVSSENKWKEVEIPQGASYSRGIDILANEGFIKNKPVFHLIGRLARTDRTMKAGYYNLNTVMTPLEIFDRLRKGMIVEFTITIPEGSNLDDIRLKLKEFGLVNDDSWQLTKDSSFLASLNITAPSIEGYIFPDSYNFAKGTDPKYIFAIMVQRMREKFNEPLMKRANQIGMTENEVLTLASIIEKEAVYDSERPLISAVYHNRLRKNMRLQADPTVLYGVRYRWGRILYSDLMRVTPYNTYVIKGLPPGPIASPGIKSIQAALNPDKAGYLFFVSMNNGRHYFSYTGKEHVKAVALYQRNGNTKEVNGEKEYD